MFEQDYLVRMFVQFAEAMRRSMQKARGEKDFAGAAELIEQNLEKASEIDGEVLLSLAPESIASVLQVSGTDPRVVEYIARSLLLEASYLKEADLLQRAELREKQAYALAEAFGLDISLDALSEEEWEEFFAEDIPEKGNESS